MNLTDIYKKRKIEVIVFLIFFMFLLLDSCCTTHKTKKQDISQAKGIFVVVMLTEGTDPRGRFIWLYDNKVLRTNPGYPEKDFIARLATDEYERLLKFFKSVEYQKEQGEMMSDYGEGCGECRRVIIFDSKEQSVTIPLEETMPPPAIHKFLKEVVKICKVKFGRKFNLPDEFREMFKDSETKRE